ncbi:resistance to inhibitors of cholinesterase protein 3 [Myripristis murdjan]|uniref:Resistance to inhibitors of cholinesterase protein 3-like n=1 Tax=Myripristis murdjan TaxID=586833 RepID=A0A668ABY0_9TELE|nr:resistance to inhibitors of cholinesterase protein 3-like [Myripristis murdjan]
MVLSTSQQVVVAFTAVLFTFVVLPRMFGVGGGTKEPRGFDPRFNRKVGPGPGAVRGQPVGMSGPASAQSMENMQQMKMMMEQEMKSDKYKSNSNKGYVFTLMPLYAIGVGVFAAYKFMKIKSADDSQAQKNKVAKGAKKSVEAENQLNELEQRLAQTERMLNSILNQLDPLTNCVKSVAQEQKNEIMSQLQTIRFLMKKRGMDCPPLNIQEASGERKLDDLIESLAAHEALSADVSVENSQACAGVAVAAAASEKVCHEQAKDEAAADAEEMGEPIAEESEREEEEDEDMNTEEEEEEEEEDDGDDEELDDSELMPSLEESLETNIEDVGAETPASGLRRRIRPE